MVLLAASAISIASTIPSWAVLHLSFLTNVSFGHSLLAQANDVFLVFTLLASITLSECLQTNFCHVLGAMKLTEQLMSVNAMQRERNSPCSWPLFSMREAVEDVLTPYSVDVLYDEHYPIRIVFYDRISAKNIFFSQVYRP